MVRQVTYVTRITFLTCFLAVIIPGQVLSEADTNQVELCKQASESLAPAQSAWVECETEKGTNNCNDEVTQLFEIGITALERCGPFEPQAICSSLGDPREICTDEQQCARAEAAWATYCVGTESR